MSTPTARSITELPQTVARLWERRTVFAPFALAGVLAIVAGGTVAAVIAAPTPTRHGVWSVAYLILVMGVAQLALGAGQTLLPRSTPAHGPVHGGAAVFNLANLMVIAGVITERSALLTAGSVLLFAALGVFLYQVRDSDRRGWTLHIYRAVVTVLAVSIPIGLVINAAAGH